jgi:hypothetical protein
VLATAVAAALTLSAANASAQTKGAATKADLQAVQSQLQTLVDRVTALETTNATLKTENAELKALADRREAEMDYLKQQTRDLRADGANAANDLSKVKGADWATKIKFKGDFRMRDENIVQERTVASGTSAAVDDAADRNRARLRARFGLDAQVTDTTKVSFGLASGSDSDPRSTNQTIGGENSKKSLWLDYAFVDWRFMNGGDAYLGKMKYPFWRPGQSLFFDGDINPEGVAVAIDRGMLFGSAYLWALEERFNSNPASQNSDTLMWGTQIGLKFPLAGGETRVAAHYYDLTGGQNSNPFWVDGGGTAQPYGNSVVTLPNTGNNPLKGKQVLLYDYNVIMLSAEMGLKLGNLPFSLWADYALNTASDVQADTAYAVGVVLGKASNAKTWEVGLMYESLDKDALFAQFIDSDFADGTTNSDGWVLKGGWAPAKNVTLNGTYFLNTRTACGVGTSPSVNSLCGSGIPNYDLDYKRLQLDVNYKF